MSLESTESRVRSFYFDDDDLLTEPLVETNNDVSEVVSDEVKIVETIIGDVNDQSSSENVDNESKGKDSIPISSESQPLISDRQQRSTRNTV